MAVLAGVFPVPMLIDGVRHLCQPGTVFEKFQNIRRAEKLDTVLRGVAKRLEQPGRDQRRNIVRLAIEHPPRLLRSEAGRQLPQKGQKSLLIFSHATPVAPRA